MAFQKPPGTQDILPGTTEKWQFVEEKARDICRRFNFREIRTPMFEATELFQRGVGETTDIVEKEMYTFTDRGNRSLTLRPEGTAGVMRAYVENKLYGEPDVSKLYYVGPMFRYERQQAGRYRQFHQFGIEALGSDSPALDAEVIALAYTFYNEVGLKGVRVEINSVGTSAIRAQFRDKLLAFLLPKRELLCKDCQSRMERNPLRVLDCKTDQHHFEGAPSILDSLDEECRIHFEQVQSNLQAMNIPFTINPKLVRGLDYYTHTAFEFKAEGIGSIDTIGGGGRFNGLIEEIGGPSQPGVGLAIGLERTVMLLAGQEAELEKRSRIDIYLVALGEQAEQRISGLLYELRLRGISAERDYLGRKMKAQMKSADRLQARFTAILGDDELDRGEIALKNMANGEQRTVALSQLADELIQSLKGDV
ncbi:histidine--tRNA ligase [Paenibacillus sp. GCM10012307]|uniref:Histidine--tRNA ligase n=1 Tax=Paenibacillus roseus TaxID=2798579 RepID=A0A934J981_9BACL|nr:histidine--tRNA ligase [Paenibacillus roseus]MBJ6362976.1 histidine--tRNA ligase [Paenibacillus roseus]